MGFWKFKDGKMRAMKMYEVIFQELKGRLFNLENKLTIVESKLSQAFEWLEELEDEENSRGPMGANKLSQNEFIEQINSDRH